MSKEGELIERLFWEFEELERERSHIVSVLIGIVEVLQGTVTTGIVNEVAKIRAMHEKRSMDRIEILRRMKEFRDG
jgi:hypothetical protein